jgi:tripartite ATP-independent transporter DctM subunit
MFDSTVATVLIVSMGVLISLGVHIAVALGISSALGIYLITSNFDVVQAMVASTATEALRDFNFAVIPLFMLMGEFIGRTRAIDDIYVAINRGIRALPGRLAIATVLGNAIFSFVTGVSIASAAAFSRIAYPPMKAMGYRKSFALGAIAGSSCLGMLIPPSVLMIVWGILTEQSIGALFLAGVLPGILLTGGFIVYILAVAILRPEMVGEKKRRRPGDVEVDVLEETLPEVAARSGFTVAVSFVMVFGLVVFVLGGIWAGYFTPTEGAGAGAVVALVFSLIRGMRGRELFDAVIAVGRTSAPILLLLLSAALYSRVLAMTGLTNAVQDLFGESGLSPFMILMVMIGVWFVLGMVIDSISIMLLTVPIFAPLALTLGYDPISFAILGIIAIEAGLLSPPFGLLVYTVKAAITERDVSLSMIFWGSTPYWVVMLILIFLLIEFPAIATWLPSLAF